MLTKNIETMKTEVAQHIAADAVAQNVWWRHGKGCFVGCLTHNDFGDYQAVAERFGMPLSLVHIAEFIFEKLPAEEAPKFFAEIPEAIGSDGRDLSLAIWVFLGDLLRGLPKQKANIQAAIDRVIEGMDLLASGREWPDAARDACAADAADAAYAAARAAARAAANAAARAADAARDAASDEYAARDAASDEYAARDAARAARAARDAAEIQRQRALFTNAIKSA